MPVLLLARSKDIKAFSSLYSLRLMLSSSVTLFLFLSLLMLRTKLQIQKTGMKRCRIATWMETWKMNLGQNFTITDKILGLGKSMLECP
jgi:hypothetical protein